MQRLVGFLQSVGSEPVVAVEHRDEFTVGNLDALVPSYGLTTVLGLLKHHNAGVARGIFLQYQQRGVGGVVVDADYLDVFQCLRAK